MIKKVFLALSVCLISLSCDNDSQKSSIDDNANNEVPQVVMTGYKINSLSDYSENGVPHTYQKKTIGNLLNNKLFSETGEVFIDGVSQGTQTIQNYFYTGNLLTKRSVEGDVIYFFYDANQNLIGLKWEKAINGVTVLTNYRFSYHPNNVAFVEKIFHPYDDPAAVIWRRTIVQLDGNNNIIKAGKDVNLDGVMDGVNQFFYTNDNLTSLQKSDGTVVSFEYSNVIDNFMVLNYNSYGKKVLRLLDSEWHASPMYNDFGASKNLKNQELLDATYEVLGNNYYKKKTMHSVYPQNDAENTTSTEFFFQ